MYSSFTNIRHFKSRIRPLVLASSRHFQNLYPAPAANTCCLNLVSRHQFQNYLNCILLIETGRASQSRQLFSSHIPPAIFFVSCIPYPAYRLNFMPHPTSRQIYVGPGTTPCFFFEQRGAEGTKTRPCLDCLLDKKDLKHLPCVEFPLLVPELIGAEQDKMVTEGR